VIIPSDLLNYAAVTEKSGLVFSPSFWKASKWAVSDWKLHQSTVLIVIKINYLWSIWGGGGRVFRCTVHHGVAIFCCNWYRCTFYLAENSASSVGVLRHGDVWRSSVLRVTAWAGGALDLTSRWSFHRCACKVRVRMRDVCAGASDSVWRVTTWSWNECFVFGQRQ
jgi:hypothetical protein